jgi:hypothetical protein
MLKIVGLLLGSLLVVLAAGCSDSTDDKPATSSAAAFSNSDCTPEDCENDFDVR